ncbi:MAG: MBL fold metallo-hydrolase [Candidatus Thorarchaeota archaeon]|nr:MBL fold metallo-hydrolase [Candidatus Thorarchaeota archaeon]
MTNLIDGVSRIEIPTPFPVGNINCYLIEGSPLTLIDTGPKTSKSLAAIRQKLHTMSYKLSDIEQILLTHGHIDHIGLVAQFVREREHIHENSTEVWIHQKDAEALVNYERYMDLYMGSIVKLIAASGVPGNEALMLAQEGRTELFKSIGESVPQAHSFKDDASFKTGIGSISAVWVPGHSPGSTCFVCDEQQVIFSGDHILGDISSNPSISFDSSEKIGMLTYFDSLDRISSKESYVALPGHREPIRDIKARISTLRAEYDDKLRIAADSLSDNPKTVYEISRMVYGDYEVSSLVLALAESHDLLRILESRNEAMLIKENGTIHVVKN